MKKDKNKYRDLRKLVKKHNLRDYKECNTKEGLHRISTHIPGEDRNDTRPYVPLSDVPILYAASCRGTYDSDKDTGY